MASNVNVIVVGSAGCGKTSLVAAFGRWFEREFGERPAYVNLDPGVLKLPYEPSYDVRSIVRVDALMRDEGLGPNGAMIRAAEIIEERVGEVVGEIEALEPPAGYTLIDTPGQIELFLFRDMGPKIVEALSENSRAIAVYIMDPSLASTPSGLAINFSLAIVTRLRLRVPVVSIINKSDLPIVLRFEELTKDESRLMEEIAAEEQGLIADLSMNFIKFVGEFSKAMRVVKVSAKTGDGMAELYNLVNDALCECGDLT